MLSLFWMLFIIDERILPIAKTRNGVKRSIDANRAPHQIIKPRHVEEANRGIIHATTAYITLCHDHWNNVLYFFIDSVKSIINPDKFIN